MRRRAGVLLIAAAMAAASASCGGSSAASQERSVSLTVLAASSLTNVLPQIARRFTTGHPEVELRFTFGGTDTLTAQIEQGAPADVFAGASTKYGDQLSGEHLIDAPKPFCTNRLVLIVPSSNPAGIHGLAALARPGIKLVVGAESVPVGSYTRTVLSNLDATLGAAYSKDVLANVVSNEDNVEGVLTKVETGEADAGFVYITDARSAGSQVTPITLPADGQAVATYPIAVIKAGAHPGVAGQFVQFVLSPTAQALLRSAGFGPPPSS